MSVEPLYRRVMQGQRVRYLPVIDDRPADHVVEYTDEECLTVAGSLGITLMMILEKNLPKTPNGSPGIIERKIRDARNAITELYRGTGKSVHDDIANQTFNTWNYAMTVIATQGFIE